MARPTIAMCEASHHNNGANFLGVELRHQVVRKQSLDEAKTSVISRPEWIL